MDCSFVAKLKAWPKLYNFFFGNLFLEAEVFSNTLLEKFLTPAQFNFFVFGAQVLLAPASGSCMALYIFKAWMTIYSSEPLSFWMSWTYHSFHTLLYYNYGLQFLILMGIGYYRLPFKRRLHISLFRVWSQCMEIRNP